MIYTRSLLIAAALPAVVLLLYIYRKDRLEKEPADVLLRLLGFGVLAAFAAYVLERAGFLLLDARVPQNSPFYRVLEYFGIVAYAEEGAKYFLLKKKTWKERSFNCLYDGVVYAVFVSLGFALWENIKYVFAYGMGTAVIRSVTAVPGHACFGVLMGAWYGVARLEENRGRSAVSKTYRILALVTPAFIHGLYDFIASDTNLASGVFWIFVMLLFSAAFLIVRRISDNDRTI